MNRALADHAQGAAFTVKYLIPQFEDDTSEPKMATQRRRVREALESARREIEKLARMYRGETR